MTKLNKRTFKICALAMLCAASMTTAAAFLSGCPTQNDVPSDEIMAKNIIVFIGDGMQLEHEIATSRYLFGTDNDLSFHQLPYQTSVTTWDVRTYDQYAWQMNLSAYNPLSFKPEVGYSPLWGGAVPFPMQSPLTDGYFLNWYSFYGDDTHDRGATRQPATDSASAATAMATGLKTDPGNISWLLDDPADGAILTIGEKMRAHHGALFGVATTVPFDHATPACWAGHGPNRNDYAKLGDSMLLDVKADVIIGGGHPLYYKGVQNGYDYKYISESTYNTMVAETGDYVFAERTDEVAGETVLADTFASALTQGKKVFGLFGGSGSEFESPIPADDAGEPSVTRATNENPLLHQIVTQTLDYMTTADGGKGFFVMFEQGDIDWANHADDYARMVGTTWDLHLAVQAAIDFVDAPDDDIDWTNTLLIVTSDHGNSYMRLTDEPRLGAGELPEQVALTKTSAKTFDPDDPDCTNYQKAYEYRYSYPGGEVIYHSNNHTNEPVMLYAKGTAAKLFEQYEGAWYPGTRLIDNTHIYKVCAEAAGVEYAK